MLYSSKAKETKHIIVVVISKWITIKDKHVFIFEEIVRVS